MEGPFAMGICGCAESCAWIRRSCHLLVLLHADPEVSPAGGPATYLRVAHARNFFQNYCVKQVVTRAG